MVISVMAEEVGLAFLSLWGWLLWDLRGRVARLLFHKLSQNTENKERSKEEVGHSTLVGVKFNKQGNLRRSA